MAYRFETLQIHAGQETVEGTTRSRAVPIYQTSAYTFDDADHAARLFALQEFGNIYSRIMNPTNDVLEKRVAALEGGAAALAFASGQAASAALLLALARPGANVVVSQELFGGTFALARKLLEPWGCAVRAVAPTPEAVSEALDGDSVGVWLETIANPSGTVPDLSALAEAAHAGGAPLLVDNTWGCGGYLCRPLSQGADAVIHSATKWIGGHGTFIAGVLVDGGSFDWGSGRFPAFATPDARGRSYLERAGRRALAARAEDLGLFTLGMTLSPYAAFLGLQGLETLSLRVQRSCDSALALAQWLAAQPGVERVLYPGLPSHPSHATARRVLEHGFGAVLAFETRDAASARAFLDATRLASQLANIGDAKTVVIQPWSTTHAGLSEAARRAAGVTPAMIRVSVGLEDLGDLKRDFAGALAALPA